MRCMCVSFAYRYLSVSPSASFIIDHEIAIDPEYEYVADDPSFSAELPDKQTSLINLISLILSLYFLH